MNKGSKSSAVVACTVMAMILLGGALVTVFVGCGKTEETPKADTSIEVEAEPESELPEMAASAIEDSATLMPASEDFVTDDTAASLMFAEDESSDVAADVPDDAVLVDMSDPYSMYLVPEDWAMAHGGTYVQKNGELYSVEGYVPEKNIDSFGMGYVMGDRTVDNDGVARLFLYDDPAGVRDEIPTSTRHGIITSGDFDILSIAKGDEIKIYSDIQLPTLLLRNAEFTGYTIEASDHSGTATMTYFPIIDHVLISDDIGKSNVGVFDENDTPVADVRNLEYGKGYLYEYYTGTEYHEIHLVANCKCYEASDAEIEVPIELTKNGYSTVDLSQLEPGIYACGSSVFELTE